MTQLSNSQFKLFRFYKTKFVVRQLPYGSLSMNMEIFKKKKKQNKAKGFAFNYTKKYLKQSLLS